MKTYDPKDVQVTIAGVPLEGFASVEYRDPPERPAAADGTVTARVFIVSPALESAMRQITGLPVTAPELRRRVIALLRQPTLPLP